MVTGCSPPAWIGETGDIDLHVFNVEAAAADRAENTYATPTPAIRPGRVYVDYGTYGTACLNSATGSIVWTRRLNCDHETGAGPCSPPFLLGNLLIVNVDGRDVQYMIALDTSSGKDRLENGPLVRLRYGPRQ